MASYSEDIIVDALPYIDQEYNDEGLRHVVDKLVEEEMKRSKKTPEQYLQELGLERPELDFSSSVFTQNELERIANAKPQTPFDKSRYKVEPPPEKHRQSLEAWQKAIDNVAAQLQHQSVRLVNLELLRRFGANAWKTHNKELEGIRDTVQNNIKATKKDIEGTNRKRKQEQTNAAPKLVTLEQRFREYVGKANEIELVCYALEREVKRLRTSAEAKGLKLPESVTNGAQQPVASGW